MAWGLWFALWLAVLTLITASSVILVAPIDRDGRMVQALAKWWGRSLLRVMRVPLEVHGLEHLVPGQAYVFAANHRSDFDIFALLAILPGRILFGGQESRSFEIPVFGQALTRMGSVSVDRDNLKQAMKSLDQATAIVKAGVSMIILPGRHPGPTRELMPFKKGVFIMAIKAGQPVVPVSISGTRFIQPRGTMRMKPGPMKVVISPPIDPRDLPAAKRTSWPRCARPSPPTTTPTYPYGPGNSALG